MIMGGRGDLTSPPGLAEFWQSLDSKQKLSLLTLRRDVIKQEVSCSLCQELVDFAMEIVEADATRSRGKGQPKHMAMSRMSDGAFVASSAPAQNSRRKATEFSTYQSGCFELVQNSALDKYVVESQDNLEELLLEDSGDEKDGHSHGSIGPCYCADKYDIRFVDMLTYPRPIRKFKMLLDKNMKLSVLKEMMTAEVGLEHVNYLVLMVRNKRLRDDQDQMTLEQLGFKNGLQVIISKVLGMEAEDRDGMNEKNKQFVGDLLFGQTNKDGQPGAGAGSIVDTLRLNNGYQILGRMLERIARRSVYQQWRAEVRARENERALLEALEAEEATSEEASKKKSKKLKKKEKEKKRKQEEAQKKKEEDEERQREIQARMKANQEKIEAERRAREEQRRKKAEEEELRWKERMERKKKQDEEELARRLQAERERAAKRKQEEEEQRRKKKAEEEAKAKAAKAASNKPVVQPPPPQQQQVKASKGKTQAQPQQPQPQQKAAPPKPSPKTSPVGVGPIKEAVVMNGTKPPTTSAISPPSVPTSIQDQRQQPIPSSSSTTTTTTNTSLEPPPGLAPSVRGLERNTSGERQSSSSSSVYLGHVMHMLGNVNMNDRPDMVPTSPEAEARRVVIPPPAPSQGGLPQPRFCSECGSPLMSNARFCSQCGLPVMNPHLAAQKVVSPSVVATPQSPPAVVGPVTRHSWDAGNPPAVSPRPTSIDRKAIIPPSVPGPSPPYLIHLLPQEDSVREQPSLPDPPLGDVFGMGSGSGSDIDVGTGTRLPLPFFEKLRKKADKTGTILMENPTISENVASFLS